MSKKFSFYYNKITILKVIATFLITWFHFKWTVPEQYSFIFIGGAIGNAIFFYCSGYLLKFNDETFKGEWLIRKYIRIMPSVYCFYLLLFLYNLLYNTLPLLLTWYNLFYPTTYWFVNAILCYFLCVYLIKFFKLNLTKRVYAIISFFVIISHVLFYYLMVPNHQKIIMDEGGLKVWFYYFLFFLWGMYDKQFAVEREGKTSSCIKIILSIALFFFYKKMAPNFLLFCEFQVIIIPLLLAYIIYNFQQFASYIYTIKIPVSMQKLMSFFANLTLDIYIVQMFLINLLMPEIPFPVNTIITFLVIIVVAYINNKMANIISSLIYKIL